MIKTEMYSEDLVRTYSDAGFKIKQDGTDIIYDEAIDPVFMNRTYTETDIPLDYEEEEEGEEPSGAPNEAEEILQILLGEVE